MTSDVILVIKALGFFGTGRRGGGWGQGATARAMWLGGGGGVAAMTLEALAVRDGRRGGDCQCRGEAVEGGACGGSRGKGSAPELLAVIVSDGGVCVCVSVCLSVDVC